MPTTFDATGDLNDGITRTVGTPNDGPEVVEWSQGHGGLTTQITFDFGSAFDLTEVKLGSFVHLVYSAGSPTDVDISFSADGVTYSTPTLFNTGFSYVDGHQDSTIPLSSTGSQFVRLDFDGSFTGGNKWGLDEVTFQGTPTIENVPEPASIAIWSVLALCLAGYGYRRRRQ